MLPKKNFYFKDDPDNWENMSETNGYLFGLKLDVPYYMINPYAYRIGGISNKNPQSLLNHNYTDAEILDNLYQDLDYLGLSYEIIDPQEEADWKIALMLYRYQNQIKDFQLLRFYEDSWYYKHSFKGRIYNKDFSGNIITDPRDCYLIGKEHIASLKLTKKKQ